MGQFILKIDLSLSNSEEGCGVSENGHELLMGDDGCTNCEYTKYYHSMWIVCYVILSNKTIK